MMIYLFSENDSVLTNGTILKHYNHVFYDANVKKIVRIMLLEQTCTDLVTKHRYYNDAIPLPPVTSTFNISEDEFVIKNDVKNLYMSNDNAFIAVCEQILMTKILDKL